MHRRVVSIFQSAFIAHLSQFRCIRSTNCFNSFPGNLFTDPPNAYYSLDGANEWSGSQQPYVQGQSQAQQYAVLHNQMPPATPVSANNMAMFDNSTLVSSPSLVSVSSLPPMSTFTNRPSQPTLVSSPVDIKPDLSALYSSPNPPLESPHQPNPTWSMHRPASTAMQPYPATDLKSPTEVTHLHTMVTFHSLHS